MSQKAAHVMTARQKKGALSSVKKAKLPKNVMVKHDIDYWPSLDEKQNSDFFVMLETFLADPTAKDHLTIGMDSTLRNIKKAQSLVLADEISPRWFAKHLIAMAVHTNPQIQIFIVPKLKEVTKNLLKIPTIIFSIKNSATTKEIDELYKSVGTHSELLKHFYTIRPSVNVSLKRKKEKKEVNDPPVVLLKKSETFIPMVAKVPVPSLKKQDTSDFIAFSTLKVAESAEAPVPLYRPIKIKKVSANPNRKNKK